MQRDRAEAGESTPVSDVPATPPIAGRQRCGSEKQERRRGTIHASDTREGDKKDAASGAGRRVCENETSMSITIGHGE
jgi:hypothetical protein